jgi:hypothetical protein
MKGSCMYYDHGKQIYLKNQELLPTESWHRLRRYVALTVSKFI